MQVALFRLSIVAQYAVPDLLVGGHSGLRRPSVLGGSRRQGAARSRVQSTATGHNQTYAYSNHKKMNTQNTDLQHQIAEKAKLAVAQFQERAGGRLDYSEQSIEMVEEMLAEASQFSNQMADTDQNALVQLMGSYILEVAQRQLGGSYQWHEGRDQPVLVVGDPEFSVAIITFDKVRGRLGGDEADNVVFFFRGFVDRVKSAVQGTNALYL